MPNTIYTDQHRSLAALLRTIRHEQALTQEEVARRLQRPQSFVSKYESGQRRFDLIELRAIAHALGVSLGDLVERFENE